MDTHDMLEKLNGLSSQKCLIPLHEVSWLDIQPKVGYTRHELGAILSTPRVNRHMEIALSGIHADMYPIIAPLEVKGGYCIILSIEYILHTDGSLMGGFTAYPSVRVRSVNKNVGNRHEVAVM
jgi:hypothetical protein